MPSNTECKIFCLFNTGKRLLAHCCVTEEMQDPVKLQIHIKSGSNVQQFYHVLAEDRPPNTSSLHTGSSKGLKWTPFPPCCQIPRIQSTSWYKSHLILYFSVHQHLQPVHPLCVLHQPPPIFTHNDKNPKAINRVILLLL